MAKDDDGKLPVNLLSLGLYALLHFAALAFSLTVRRRRRYPGSVGTRYSGRDYAEGEVGS